MGEGRQNGAAYLRQRSLAIGSQGDHRAVTHIYLIKCLESFGVTDGPGKMRNIEDGLFEESNLNEVE